MTFYGPASGDDLRGVHEHLQQVKEIYDRNDLPSFLADNLVTLCRNLSFKEDPKFVNALRNNCLDDDDWMKVWRLHTYCWACKSVLSVGGDFVECGVFKGLYSGTMVDYLDFETRDKRLYLYDTFAGLAEKYSTDTERGATQHHYEAVKAWVHGFVVDRFEKYPNVEVIKGVVPEMLHETAPEEIAFLHLDMNAGQAEAGALEVLFDRMADGGIVLLDDFGRREQIEVYRALSGFFARRDIPVLELPTGQGLVIKRARG